MLSITCKTEDIWEYNIEHVREKLNNSDFNFIYLIDFEKYSGTEILKLGEDAPFYFYHIFKELNLNVKAMEILNLLHKRGQGIYSNEAVLILLETLLENEEYEEIEDKALSFLWRIPDSPITFSVQRAYIEALYWQKKDNEVITHINNLFNDLNIKIESFNKQDNNCTELKYSEIAELILFKAVSSCRLNTAGWTDIFEYLYINQSVSELHVRAYQYLTVIEPNNIFSFTNKMQLFLKGKYLISIGSREEGISYLETALESFNLERFEYSPVIKELGFAYLNTENSLDGALFLDELSKRLTGAKKLEAVEMAGRIYNKQEDFNNAYDRLNTVAGNSTNSLQRDRCLWFILEMKINESAETGMREIIANSSKWSNLDYFSDQIHILITEFVKIDDYENLKYLYLFLKEKYAGPYDCLIRAEFILLRNGQLEISEIPMTMHSEYIKPYMTIELYYYFLISYLNNTLKENLYKIINIRETFYHAEQDIIESEYDYFVTGFFLYGLPYTGYEYIIKYIDEINSNTLFYTAKILNEQQYYLEAISIMAHYSRRKPALPNYSELTISYPKAFNIQIDELAKRDSIPAPVIYGIIRSESAFNLNISSYAGAIGLMQLMPGTADDMAELLGISEVDLENPYQNLALGTRYMRHLNERFDTLSKSVIAYNAGPGNMRKWQSEFYNYPSDLVSELIPFISTKHYIKNVINASIIFAVLYEYAEPEEILLLFYPDIKTHY